MRKINNKNIRNLIKKNIHIINKIYKKDLTKTAKISNIDSIVSTINSIQKLGEKIHYQVYDKQLMLANLSIICTSMLSLSIYSSDFEEEIFPKDLLSKNEKPNPNLILSNMFVQMTNYSLATITLLEKGLDNPARALVRIILELSSQIIILIYFHDDFKEFIKGVDEHISTKIWYRLFRTNKINKKISLIEEKIFNDDEFIKLLRRRREDEYKFFSQAIHNSYVAVNLGAYSSRCDDENIYERSLFGGENCFIGRTIEYLNYTLYLFLVYFFRIIDVQKNPNNELFWKDSIALYMSLEKLYMEIYYPKKECNSKTQEQTKSTSNCESLGDLK